MSAPSPPLVVACPKCGERLGVRAADVGKRGKCRGCGSVFRIAGKGADAAQPQASEAAKLEAAAPPKPTTVTFPCELCETRITTAAAHVGKTIKCPDCGRRNVIPAPIPAAAPRIPAAMSGEQFDLWAVGEAPSPDELAAQAPMLHPVVCELCQTLMYATEAQVGARLKCPDCGTLTIAQRREPVKPHGPVIVPDGDEYQLDEASAPPPRPVYRPVELRDLRDESFEKPSRDGAPVTRGDAPRVAEAPRGTGVEVEASSREAPRRAVSSRLGEREAVEAPKMPRVPLVQGFWRMLLTSEVLIRWALLSIALMIAGWFLSWVLNAMGAQVFQVFMAIPLFAVGCVFFGLWLLTMMPLCLAIVTESSEGNDRLHDPPSWISMDFAEVFFVVIAAAVSAIPAWLTLKATGTLPVEAQEAIAVGTWLVFFPVVLLSNLEQSSAFAVFSPRLASSLARCAGPWLLFYIESALLALAVYAALEGMIRGPWWLAYVGPWVTVSTLLVYMRLIGRLAWWLAESMPVAAEAERD